jgi:splicing factor 3A subunit 1
MVIQGIIRPPPEIRAVCDRTALYVAKNGRAFETKILNSSKGKTPKFAFLHENNPYHNYYEDRIQFYENGGTDEKESAAKAKDDEEEAKKQKEADDAKLDAGFARQQENRKGAKSVIDPVAKALLEQRARIAAIRSSQSEVQDGVVPANGIGSPPPPPPLHFCSIVAPASLTPVQLETIQAVAQFAALGRHANFLDHLSRTEWNNPYFAFCQPRHGHFAYFSALVDTYGRIMNSWSTTDPSDPVHRWANNVDACLQDAAYRAEYEHDQRKNQNQDEQGPAKIDWHDFVVVETIDFDVDEVVTMLPPPPPALPVTAPAVAMDNAAMEDSDEEDDGETIRVVPTYTPRVVTRSLETTVIDPITGKSVNVKDMPEHMRIQLLDPKWAEERKKFQDKQKETNLVGGDVVASNLERFAEARGDPFGKKVRLVYILRFVCDKNSSSLRFFLTIVSFLCFTGARPPRSRG